MKNKQTNILSAKLKKAGKPVWKRLAAELERPARLQRRVNVAKLSKLASDQTLVVPGKVLGAGIADKPFTVAAFSFSNEALKKIKTAKGTAMSVDELLAKQADGKNIKIIG